MGGTATLAGHAAGCLAPSSAELGGALSLLPGASNRICVCKCVRAFNLASSDWTPALLCRPCLRVLPTHQHTRLNTHTHTHTHTHSLTHSLTHSHTHTHTHTQVHGLGLGLPARSGAFCAGGWRFAASHVAGSSRGYHQSCAGVWRLVDARDGEPGA